MKQIITGIPNTLTLFISLISIVGILYFATDGAILQTAYGSCGNLGSLSPHLDYYQTNSLSSNIINLLSPEASSLGVFKGTISFSGPCETVNAQTIDESGKTATTKSISAYMQELSCDYTLTGTPTEANLKKLTYNSVTFNSMQGRGGCSVDLLAMFLIDYNLNKPHTFSSSENGDIIPVSCESGYRSICEATSGYKAYFNSNQRTTIGGTSIGLKEPAICAKVESSSTGRKFYSSSGLAFKPNTKVLINYGGEQITLDTEAQITAKGTSDKNAVFMLNENSGSFSVNCPTGLNLYYIDPSSSYFVQSSSEQNVGSAFSTVNSKIGSGDMVGIKTAVINYNKALADLGSTKLTNAQLTGVPTISGNGQFVSIDRLDDPNINPKIDFIVVADKVSVTSEVASPVFMETYPRSGECLDTTTTTTSTVYAKVYSSSKGKAMINVLCNTPLGLKSGSKELSFPDGGGTLTASFNFVAPANSYDCKFTAFNYALGSYQQYSESSGFCVESEQVEYDDCSVATPGTLKTNNPTTGSCECMISESQGTSICQSSGMIYDKALCSCKQSVVTPDLCKGQPTNCEEGYKLSKNAYGCNICVEDESSVSYNTCQEEVDKIRCGFLDYGCESSKTYKRLECILDQLTIIVVAGSAVAIVLGIAYFATRPKGGRRK